MSHRIPDSIASSINEKATFDYRQFRDFLQDSCGIVLGDNKQYLVTSRINKLMKQKNIANLGELVNEMKKVSNNKLKESVIDAMTTNETLWFRDNHPFDIFKNKLLPEFEKKAGPSVRVWSAACSSGQEPYSLSMLVEEYRSAKAGGKTPSVEILATDLSSSMLESCKKAEYDALSLGRGLSNERKKRFFEVIDNDVCKVNAEVRQRVRFQSLNLMDSFLSLGKFDIVFCRNVLIYFSAQLKSDILKRIHATLRPDGYLVLGASEGLTDASEYFKMIQCKPGIIYQSVK